MNQVHETTEKHRVICPICEAVLKSEGEPPRQARIRCNICGAKFTVAEPSPSLSLDPETAIIPISGNRSVKAIRFKDALAGIKPLEMKTPAKPVLDPAITAKRTQFIQNLRTRLGAPPRQFSHEELHHIRIYPPTWLKDDDELMGQYDHQRTLSEYGFISWGAILQADSELLKQGDEDRIVIVLYSPNDPIDDPQPLKHLAMEWTAASWNTDVDFVTACEEKSEQRLLGVALPKLLDSGNAYQLTSLVLHRRCLSEGRLRKSVIPLFQKPDSPYVLSVPSFFWTE